VNNLTNLPASPIFFVAAYPELTVDNVRRTLEYAAEIIDEEQVIAYA